MSASFVKRFVENENATSITYKLFNEGPEDKYPTFSICLKGSRFHWYHPLVIFDAFGLSVEQFERMVKGEMAFKYDFDYSVGLFRKTLTFFNNESDVAFDSFHLKMSDVLLNANLTALDYRDSSIYSRQQGEDILAKSPFSTTYQTPNMICFTRESDHVADLIRLEDLLTLNKNLINNAMYKATEMQIFIHHPGQLIRSLDVPNFKSSFDNYRYDKTLSFKLSQSTIVRRRPDSSEPCNSRIQDYDMFLINEVLKEMKCMPPYWKDYVRGTIHLEECTSPENLQIAYNYTKTWKAVMQKHFPPCIDMYNIAGWNWLDAEGSENPEEARIKFTYQEQYYQELEYLPGFDLETFISNVGGFVGIFLGYSLMQFPELLGNYL